MNFACPCRREMASSNSAVPEHEAKLKRIRFSVDLPKKASLPSGGQS
jgi:hypothetical protein